MIEVSATREIDAPAETVWSVLTDLDRFDAWNPFIRRASGSTDVGGTVHVRVRTGIGLRLGFHAKVVACTVNRALRWRGHVLAPWLASGDHSFEIEPIGLGRVRFVQRETFGGVLPRLAARLLAREAGRGFEAMNAALAARAHARDHQA
jgi:hypothetical protein